MTKKVSILLLMMWSFMVFSQKDSTKLPYNERVPLKDRFYYGGNFWLSFGNVTLVNISPRIGYRLSDDFSLGLGGRYQYSSFKPYQSSGYRETASVYGGSAFARYDMFDNLFLLTEYESLNVTNFFYYPGATNQQHWTDFWFIGGGYGHNIGGGFRFQALVMYDILNNPDLGFFYPRLTRKYPLIIRFGVTFGI